MFSLDHKYLDRLVESSPDIIVAVDVDGAIIYYNDGARRSLHYTAEEIIGQNVLRLYPSREEARRVMQEMRRSPEGGRISTSRPSFAARKTKTSR